MNENSDESNETRHKNEAKGSHDQMKDEKRQTSPHVKCCRLIVYPKICASFRKSLPPETPYTLLIIIIIIVALLLVIVRVCLA